ncbi:MAG: hypothetical protein AAB325_08415 [Pseudomonadota bacterium]
MWARVPLLSLCAQIGLLAPATQATSYSAKPIRIIAPFTAGGGDWPLFIVGRELQINHSN